MYWKKIRLYRTTSICIVLLYWSLKSFFFRQKEVCFAERVLETSLLLMTNDNEKEPLFVSLCTNTKYSTDIKSFKFKYKPMKPIVMNHRASVILILLIVLEVFWSIHNFFFFWKSSYWRLIISFKSSKNFILNPVFFTCRIKLYQWNPFNITNYYLKISLKKRQWKFKNPNWY